MIPPIVQNAVVCVIVTGFTFAVIYLLIYLNKRSAITTEISRKAVHLGAGVLYLALYFYNDNGYISKYFNILPNVLWIGIIIWKNSNRATIHQKYDLALSTMTRNYQQSELLYGPLFFNFVMILCGTALYKTVIGSIMIAILTWGDAFAAICGVRSGGQRKMYRNKTFDGFVSMLACSTIATVIYTSILVNFASVNFLQFFLISLIASVVETLSPSNFDNLTIPIAIYIAYSFFV